MSRPGEFSRVESNEVVGSTSGGHQQNETCTCFKSEARRLQQNMTCTCHVGKNEQKRLVNTRRLLCPCGCLDLLPLSHDGLGHALGEVKHEDPVLALLSSLDSVCTPSMFKPGSPCHQPRSIRITLPGTGGTTSARCPMDTPLLQMFPYHRITVFLRLLGAVHPC